MLSYLFIFNLLCDLCELISPRSYETNQRCVSNGKVAKLQAHVTFALTVSDFSEELFSTFTFLIKSHLHF